MKWLFNRKRNNFLMVTAWQKLSSAINRRAHKWADYLNDKATKWSARKVKVVLTSLGVLWAAGSIFIAFHAIQSKQRSYSVTSVTIPRHVQQADVTISDTAVSQAVTRIEHFKHWLDSLHQRGSPLYDSITKERPGLLDSILFIENYYLSKK